ncbi:methylated-DNA--[protein]-cysteine S-methyltransferase [Rubrobacter aplysinae]|uniref:methylated-DNA--[protein]-cysteine S-methyltransferase n=1 Tax=Rubrobacter aplysinae TaxID=909625 RepID=UPI00069E7FFD|nr:methylated-DNA--[protein]-cysteine S-methyltransferase [Rubrobacter aplysinae]
MNDEHGERWVEDLLGESAARQMPARESEETVDRALAAGTDRLFSCASPLGEVYVGASDLGVRSLGKAASPEEFARLYRERFGRLLSWGTDERTRILARRVAAAIAGERVEKVETPEVPTDLSRTTAFQKRVLGVVGGIPRGEVRPYAWVAREAGSPRASRAVGSVMARNPVPLVIPCHRVVRNDGATGDYAFGAGEKVGLLEREGVPVAEISGSPYLGSPSTAIFCYATCRSARKIKPGNRRRFRSAAEAVRAGYRPCKVCRPVVSG